jgi:hypothetical protein
VVASLGEDDDKPAAPTNGSGGASQ